MHQFELNFDKPKVSKATVRKVCERTGWSIGRAIRFVHRVGDKAARAQVGD